jgi:hypothetical protein
MSSFASFEFVHVVLVSIIVVVLVSIIVDVQIWETGTGTGTENCPEKPGGNRQKQAKPAHFFTFSDDIGGDNVVAKKFSPLIF